MLSINCKHLFIGEEDDILTIGFADKADEPTTYLLLQRSLLPSEQDKRLGQDKVYLELNEQIHSAYGGIKQVDLNDNRLLLVLDAKTADELGASTELEVRVDEQMVADLRKQLGRLFAGQEVVVVG